MKNLFKTFTAFLLIAASPLAAVQTDNQMDVVSFVATKANAQEMNSIKEKYSGLSDTAKANQLLKDQNYTEVLKMVWSEKDPKKRLQFLEAQANNGHPVLMLEYGIENLQQSPSLETFIEKTQPWLVSGIVRTQQDLSTVNDETAGTAIQELMITYYSEIDPLLQDKYTQQQAEEFMKKNEKEMIENVDKQIRMVLDPSKTLPSPKWVSYHGKKASNGENNMIPEKDWDTTRKEFAKQILGN